MDGVAETALPLPAVVVTLSGRLQTGQKVLLSPAGDTDSREFGQRRVSEIPIELLSRSAGMAQTRPALQESGGPAMPDKVAR